jgi:hypothetical protein
MGYGKEMSFNIRLVLSVKYTRPGRGVITYKTR